MEYYEFLQILWGCGSKEVFHILSAKCGDRLHNHFISKVMLMAVFSPWQSFSAGFGKLHFWSPLLEAATTAWWSQSAACGPRGQIWRASQNFAWWGACWRARCTSRRALSWDSPCERHQPLCLAAEYGPDPDPTRRHGGLCVDIVSRDRLVWMLSSTRRWPWGPWVAGLAACGGRGVPPWRSAPAVFCSVLPAEYLALGELA